MSKKKQRTVRRLVIVLPKDSDAYTVAELVRAGLRDQALRANEEAGKLKGDQFAGLRAALWGTGALTDQLRKRVDVY